MKLVGFSRWRKYFISYFPVVPYSASPPFPSASLEGKFQSSLDFGAWFLSLESINLVRIHLKYWYILIQNNINEKKNPKPQTSASAKLIPIESYCLCNTTNASWLKTHTVLHFHLRRGVTTGLSVIPLATLSCIFAVSWFCPIPWCGPALNIQPHSPFCICSHAAYVHDTFLSGMPR